MPVISIYIGQTWTQYRHGHRSDKDTVQKWTQYIHGHSTDIDTVQTWTLGRSDWW